VFLNSRFILVSQSADDGCNTAALTRSGKSKSTFNRSRPRHQQWHSAANALRRFPFSTDCAHWLMPDGSVAMVA
jgi:hypothetical protein